MACGSRERRPLVAGTRTRRMNETAKRRRETAEGADAPRARGAPRRRHSRRVCRTITARVTCLARRIGRGTGGRSAGERRRKGLASSRGARRKDYTTRGEKRRFAHISAPCSAAAARTTRPRASRALRALRGRRGSQSAWTRARTARSECKEKTRHDDEAVRRGHAKDCVALMNMHYMPVFRVSSRLRVRDAKYSYYGAARAARWTAAAAPGAWCRAAPAARGSCRTR